MLLSRDLYPVLTLAVEELEFLGLTPDPSGNSQDEGERLISTAHSAVKIWVNPANGEWILARGTYRLASGSAPK